MNAQDKGVKNTSKFELLNTRSSFELDRIFNINRENVESNIEKFDAHVAGNRENVSNKKKLPTTNVVKSNARGLDKEILGGEKPLFSIAP